MDINMVAIPECQDPSIRITLQQHALVADVSHLASFWDRLLADQDSIEEYWNSGVAYSFHCLSLGSVCETCLVFDWR
jgi:hypothetical protein